MSGNHRLDHSIHAEHDPKLIVSGRIITTEVKPRPAALDSYPADVSFQFKVTAVVLGGKNYEGRTIAIPATSFDWPESLVAFKPGVRCTLVLRPSRDEDDERYEIDAVVPANSDDLPTAEDGEGAKRILEMEILAELRKEERPERQRALLVQVAPILTKEHSSIVIPFVDSRDVWVMRAALAALIYATEAPEYIRTAAADAEHFFTTTKPDDLIHNKYGAYSFFFEHYIFMDKMSWKWGTRWSEIEGDKHLRILDAMFATGLVRDEVKKLLKPSPTDVRPGK
jgi:hypothetical protein